MKKEFVNLRQTRVYSGWLIHKIFGSPVSYILYIVLLAPFIVDAILIHDFKIADYQVLSFLIGLILVGLYIESVFMKEHISQDKVKPVINENNLACYISFDLLAHIHGKGFLIPENLWKATVNSKRSAFVFKLMGINKKEILKRINISRNENVISLLSDARKVSIELGISQITSSVMLYVFFSRGGEFEQILNDADMSLENLKEIIKWQKLFGKSSEQVGPLQPERLVQTFGPMGRSWVQGYTNELDTIASELSGKVVWRYIQRKVMLHKPEVESALQILSRSGNKNVVIVGEQESGKESMMENIGALIRMNQVEHGKELTRLLELKTHVLLSGFKEPDKVLLNALGRAEKSGKFILVIKDFAGFLKSADPSIKVVLARYLQSSSIGVIGLSTPDEYHRFLKSEPAINNQCEKIYLEDVTSKETFAVLLAEHFSIMKKGKNILCTYKNLHTILRLTERYIGSSKMPGSAIKVMKDAISIALGQRTTVLKEDHIRKAISTLAHIDISEVSDKEKGKLMNLEETLKGNIIGQDDALSALVNALKRAKMDISAGNRPLGTFLFLGPTGVGKTYTAKIIAREYFGDEEALIRVDMNDFSTEESVYGIIGDPNPSSTNAGYLSRRVQERPFSLLLLDEIEKAHPSVLNVFLQILDEGHLADSRGVKTDFRNTIIIATSNAGAKFISDLSKKNDNVKKEKFKDALIENLIEQNAFSPEFVNRFDEVILYIPLTIRTAIKVALLLLDGIVKDIAEKKGYKLQVEEDAIVEIVKKGYSVDFGAREMRRVITHSIETFLADTLLEKEVKRGEVIRIGVDDIKKYLKDK